MGNKSTLIGGIGLGVAVGVAFGFYAMAPNVVGGPTGAGQGVTQELNAERDLREQADEQSHAADEVLRGLSVEAVARSLSEHSVLVVTTPSANDETVASLGRLLSAAGATKAGEVELSDDLLNVNSGDKVKSIAANSLPAGAKLSEDNLTPGMHAGQVLGAALGKETSESDRSVVLSSLTKAGLVKIHGSGEDASAKDLSDADLAIVVTGEQKIDDDTYPADFLANFAAGLDDSLEGAVLAGPPEEAESGHAIALVREERDFAEETSTVDNIDTMAGRITAIRALAQQAADRAGHYGATGSASAASPDSQAPQGRDQAASGGQSPSAQGGAGTDSES